jgi:hypothetical protein
VPGIVVPGTLFVVKGKLAESNGCDAPGSDYRNDCQGGRCSA